MKNSKYANLLVFIAALLVIWAWNKNAPQTDVRVELKDDAVVITGPEDFSRKILFADMREAVVYGRDTDLGTEKAGKTTRNAWYGTWENEQWGEYTLAISPNLRAYLAVTDAEGEITVFNVESEEMTASLGEALAELIAAQ